MENIKLDDDRTLLQKIFKSLPRRSRLEHFSSLLLCSRGTDYRTAVCGAEWIYEEVMKFRKSIRKRLAESLLYNNVISYLRFVSDPEVRVFPETYEQYLLAERYRKVAEDSTDALLDLCLLRQPDAVCHIIECLPSKRQKALNYAKVFFGEEGVRLILYRFRLWNAILEGEKVTHRLPRRPNFNPDPDASHMAAEWLLENAKTLKSLAKIYHYVPDLADAAKKKIDEPPSQQGSSIVRFAKRVAKRVVRKIRSSTKRMTAH